MPVTKAQQKATANYKKKVYDRMEVLLSRGKKGVLQAHAASRGESLNAFVNRAIDEAVGRDNEKDKPDEVAAGQ